MSFRLWWHHIRAYPDIRSLRFGRNQHEAVPLLLLVDEECSHFSRWMIHQVFPIIRATALAVNSFLIELSAITPEYFTLAGTPSGTLFLLSTRSSFSGSAPFSLDYQRASNTGGFDSGGLHQNLLVLHGFSKLWGPQILSSPCPRLFLGWIFFLGTADNYVHSP